MQISPTFWFQDDGKPPPFSRELRQYLNEVFPHQWIGRRGEIEWPDGSPDLTSMDIHLFRYIKHRVQI